MATAASGLRAASRASLIRLRVSCRFTALKSTVFTPILLRYFNLKSKRHGHAATQRKTTNTYTTKQLGGAQIPSTSGLAGVGTGVEYRKSIRQAECPLLPDR
jgi:hypothetical protein